jgi:hypothetical protein
VAERSTSTPSRRRLAAVVPSATGDDVQVGEAELRHAARHFLLPRDLLLQLVTRVLQHPTAVYVDDRRHPHEYRLFYRLEDGRYLLVVVKLTPEGAFFASMYPTGKSVRPSHRKFKKV